MFGESAQRALVSRGRPAWSALSLLEAAAKSEDNSQVARKRAGLGDSWVKSGKREGLAASTSANPSSFMVAGARKAECYTDPESYWIDLKEFTERPPEHSRLFSGRVACGSFATASAGLLRGVPSRPAPARSALPGLAARRAP